MKIGILTASRTNNNGTDLQALAMQWLFEEYGWSAELINYKCEKLENSRKLIHSVDLRGLLSLPYNCINNYVHRAFRKKYFRYSGRVYDKYTLKDHNYDLIVVGSDQIWNLSITGNDLNFFLPFQNKALKKCSYAASFGKTSLIQWEETYDLSSKLIDFCFVSVREIDSINSLNEIGVASRHDLDPLLMIEKDKWLSISKNHSKRKPYIFIYCVDRADEIVPKAIEYAKIHKLDVLFWGNPLKPIHGVKVIRYAGIDSWISYVSEAELIITNSYHCLSFAINFHKNFSVYWLSNAPESNIRLSSLLSISGIDSCSDGEICCPNWGKVDERIQKERSSSAEYIHKMMELCDEKVY